MSAAEPIVERVAGFGLPGWRPPADAGPPDAWDEIRRLISFERLTGLAVASAEAGWLEASDEQREELLEMHRVAVVWALTVERRLLEVANAFDAETIRFVVLKGPALANTLYEDPSHRSFGDLDVLVPASDWRRASAVLERMGHRRMRPEPRAGFDERFGKAAVHRSEDGIEADLHRTLVVGPFGLWLRPDELLEHTATFELGGKVLRRLADTGLLLNACVHASLGARPPRLVPLRDVLQVATAGSVDWKRLAEWAARWRLRAVFDHAFAAASETLGVPLPEPAGGFVGVSVPAVERRTLESYTTERRRRGSTAVTAIRAIPGMRAKAAYIVALVAPERAFLDARSGNGARGSYLRRLRTPVRWVRAGVRAGVRASARRDG